MRGRWCDQKSGKPTGKGRGGAGGARGSQTERAARLWAAADAPGELSLPAEGTERCGAASAAAGNRGRTSALRLPAGGGKGAGGARKRGIEAGGGTTKRVPDVPGGRAALWARRTAATV